MDEEEMNQEPVILCWVNGVPCYNESDTIEAGKQTPPGKHMQIIMNTNTNK
jgi:hypothetical protein